MKKIIYPLITVIMLFSALDNHAENKKINKKTQKIWNNIELAFSKNEFNKGISLCHELLLRTGFNDSIAFQTRCLLAEYYLFNNQMNEIYECGVYFREYLKDHPNNEKALSLKERCYKQYNKLLEEEQSVPIPAGVYISDIFTENHLPYIAIEISYEDGNPRVRLLPCCALSEQANIYSYTKAKSDMARFATVMVAEKDDGTQCFVCNWDNTKIRKGNTYLGKSINKESYEFGKKSSGIIASSKASTSDKVQASVMTGMVTGLFDFVADEISKKTVKSHAAILEMDTVRNGTMACTLEWMTRTSRDGEAPEEEAETINTNLHRLYPHDELIFCCTSNASVLTYRSVHNTDFNSSNETSISGFSNEYINESKFLLKCAFPSAYPNGNKNNRKIPKHIMSATKINNIFYKDFLRHKLNSQ